MADTPTTAPDLRALCQAVLAADGVHSVSAVELAALARAALEQPAQRSTWPIDSLDKVQVVMPDGTHAMLRPCFAYFDAAAMQELEDKVAGATGAPSSNRVSVDAGALQMALNVLRRAGKTEVADALVEACGERGGATGAPTPQPLADDCGTAWLQATLRRLEQWALGEHHYSTNVEDTAIGELRLRHVREGAAFLAPKLADELQRIERALCKLDGLERAAAPGGAGEPSRYADLDAISPERRVERIKAAAQRMVAAEGGAGEQT